MGPSLALEIPVWCLSSAGVLFASCFSKSIPLTVKLFRVSVFSPLRSVIGYSFFCVINVCRSRFLGVLHPMWRIPLQSAYRLACSEC